MKTLDEVIKALELCTGDYDCVGHECPYRQEGTCCDIVAVPKMQADALHYLKHLQEYYEMSREHHEPNPPLTWDELKQMEGKPVWVVEKGYQTWEYWALVYWMQDDELTLLNENGQTTYSKNEQGTVWQAFRKERE